MVKTGSHVVSLVDQGVGTVRYRITDASVGTTLSSKIYESGVCVLLFTYSILYPINRTEPVKCYICT